MSDEQLRTLMCETEAIINSRPLTVSSSNANDFAPLTPNDLLTMKNVPIFPPGIFDQNKTYVTRRWKQVQYMAEIFWKRWTSEYIVMLQERQKWTSPRENLKNGDLVLIKDEALPRCSWRIGLVEEAKADQKGFVRSARIKTSYGTCERPISKLCLLKNVEALEAS